jgi:hypothetical protein
MKGTWGNSKSSLWGARSASTGPEANLLQAELNELDDRAQRWLRRKERRNVRLSIFSLASQIQAAIGRENKRHDLDKQDEPATGLLTKELDGLRPLVAKAEALLEEEAERSAKVVYALGMAWGSVVLGLFCGVLGAVFAWKHVAAVNGVGALAGGVGACLSVLQRLNTKRLELDFRNDRGMLRSFGGLRPIVGAVFGTITYCIIRAGLFPSAITVPKTPGPLLAFVAFFAFFAAFNERFFQDMLRTASGGVSSADDDRKAAKS